MLFKTFITLIAVGVALCNPQKCSSRFYEVCNMELFPKDFPDTVEELRQACNDVQELFRCTLNYLEDCLEHDNEIPEIEKVLMYIGAYCDEDGHPFQVISSNLECFTPTARSLEESCSLDNVNEEDLENIIDLSLNLMEEHNARCIEGFMEITCYSHIMGLRCGPELKEVVSDIMERIHPNYFSCDTKLTPDILKLKQAMELAYREDQIIETTINDEE